MLWWTIEHLPPARVDKRTIEESELKLDAKDATHRSIQICHRECVLLHAVNQGLLKDVVSKVIELHVHARPDGHAGSIFRRGGNMMHLIQALDRSQVREDKSLKPPLLTQDCLE